MRNGIASPNKRTKESIEMCWKKKSRRGNKQQRQNENNKFLDMFCLSKTKKKQILKIWTSKCPFRFDRFCEKYDILCACISSGAARFKSHIFFSVCCKTLHWILLCFILFIFLFIIIAVVTLKAFTNRSHEITSTTTTQNYSTVEWARAAKCKNIENY